MRDIRLLPAVLQDIAEAAAWYDDDGYSGLGDRFIATFYRYLSDIQENGEIYRKVYLDFHKVLIRPFPYTVFSGSTKTYGLSLLWPMPPATQTAQGGFSGKENDSTAVLANRPTKILLRIDRPPH